MKVFYNFIGVFLFFTIFLAYELRCLEDDDDFKPEMSFDPLAGDRNFTEYNIDSLAFCEISNFVPESNRERNG